MMMTTIILSLKMTLSENMEDIQNFTLAELFTRAENRRAGRERDNVEERQSLRSLTHENTLSNSGAFKLFNDSYLSYQF